MGKERKQQIIIKLGCILASFIFWIYIYSYINPTKTIKIKDVPVEITNTEVLSELNLALIPEEKYSVNLSLSGGVAELNKISKGDFKLVANIQDFALKKGGTNKIPVYIVKKPDNIQVLNSDIIFVEISTDDYEEKEFTIKPEIKGKAKNGYYALTTEMDTTKVKVSGPKSYVDKIANVYGTINIDGADSDINSYVDVRAVDSNGVEVKKVIVDKEKISAFIPIRKVKTVAINIKTKGTLASGIKLKSFLPEKETLDIVFLEETLDISSIDTEAVALDSIKVDSEITLNLIFPQGVKATNGMEKIKVKVSLIKDSQKNISKDISIVGLAEGLNSSLEIKNTNLVLSGEEAIINNIKIDEIVVTADLKNLGEGSHVVNLNIKLPEGITLVSKDVDRVKVNITKK